MKQKKNSKHSTKNSSSSSSASVDNNDNKPITSTGSFQLTFVKATLLLTIICVSLYFYYSYTLHSYDSFIISKYELSELYQRASWLTDKYKLLSGFTDSHDIPSELSLQKLVDKYSSILKDLENNNYQISTLRKVDSTGDETKNLVPTSKLSNSQSMNKESAETANKLGSLSLISINLKDLVLGMAYDMDPMNLVVFSASLRSHSNASEVVIFINEPIPSKHQEIALKYHITLEPFNPTVLPNSLQTFHASTLRWPLFYKYLHTMIKKPNSQDNIPRHELYGRIWMIDVRDSYFQSDPFSIIPSVTSIQPPSFHVFHGVESVTISSCGWNSGWIRDCFGTSTLSKVVMNKILCSGVSAGTTDLVLLYINAMNNIIMKDSPPLINTEDIPLHDINNPFSLPESISTLRPLFPKCERNGVDQGVHNVIIYTGIIPSESLKVWNQPSGPVANLQAKVAHITTAVQRSTSRGVVGIEMIVYNSMHSSPSVVVHQYDRYPEFQMYLFKKYVDWKNVGDVEAMWREEIQCKNYQYRMGLDLFKGICDIGVKGGINTAEACCGLCNKLSGCLAFTFANGQCFFKDCKADIHHNTPLREPGLSAYTV